MKSIILTISFLLYFQPTKCFGQNADGWTTYTENINTGLTLTFSHPDNTKVTSDENARCISRKIAKTNIDWCFWLADSSETSISESIAEEKKSFKGQTSIQSDTILIDNIKCYRVTLKSNLKDDPFKQIVFLTKFGTTFEIINNSGLNTNFDKFCLTIRITKTEKNPSH